MNTAVNPTSSPDTQLVTVKPSQLEAILQAVIEARAPLLITGAPGVGKSDLVGQSAVKAKARMLDPFHPVVSNPTDFAGMPWVENGEANFIPFGNLKALMTAQGLTVCFIDDLGQASPAVQAAAMQLLLARSINGHRVSEDVVFVAATNRRRDRAGVQGILEPVKTRFVSIVELKTDENDWCRWAATADIEPAVIAFIRYRPELLWDFVPTADMTNSPSPRMWAQVSKIVRMGLPSDLQVPMFQGAVGKGAAQEFTGFLRVWQDMVSPDLILTNPDTAPIPNEISARWAVTTALATRVTDKTMTRYARYLERLMEASYTAIAALSMKLAVARNPKLTNTPGFIKAMSGPLGQLMLGTV